MTPEEEKYLASLPPFSATGEPVKEGRDRYDNQHERAREINRRNGVPEGEQRPQPSAIDGHRPDSNPKSALGIKKPPLHLVSPISILHEAMAMAEGGMKYGPYNYREDQVAATVYIAAMLRHIFAWSMGEENAKDSKLHHLGHAKACCGILLDAQAVGSMIDDRFKCEAYAALIEQFDAMLPIMAERIAAMKSELEAHNR